MLHSCLQTSMQSCVASTMELILRYTYISLFIIINTVTISDAQPTLEVTAPLNPIETGGVLGIHCQVWGLDSNHEVTILRTVNNDVQRLTLGDGVTHGAEDRVFLAPRQLEDGSIVYFMSIMDVTRADEGVYSCRVVNKAKDSSVSTDSVVLNVMYFPSEADPACSPSEPLTFLEGTPMSFNCSSEVAYPHVDLSWSRVGTTKTFETNDETSAGRAASVLTLTALRSYDDAVFLCQITSIAFPEKSRSCHVGPLTIIRNRDYDGRFEDIQPARPGNDRINNNGNLVTKIPTNVKIGNEDVHGREVECAELCSSLGSSNDTFFWIVATIVGAGLALTFFIMGVFLLIKYYRMPSHPQPRYMAVQQPYHDIYAELDGRRNEGKVYMTLEHADKPNRLNEMTQVSGHYDVMPNLPKL